MGGFYKSNRGSISISSNAAEDAEVENLLNQVQEEGLLEIATAGFSHRSTQGSDDLDENLVARFANLKSRPPPEARKNHPGKAAAASGAGAKKSSPPPPPPPPAPVPDSDSRGKRDGDLDGDGDEDQEDVLAAELESRLRALKSSSGESQSSRSPQQRQQVKGSSSSSSSPAMSSSSSSSVSSGRNRSFSPMKMLKQLSMGKKKDHKPSSRSPSSSGENDSVDKLLTSAADEVRLEKKGKNKKKKKTGKGLDDDEEEDEDEIDGESLLSSAKDLDLKNLKKELAVASIEEGRLTREAQQVIEWAKDAARLEKSINPGSDDDEADLEELLRMEQEHKDDEGDDDDERKLGSGKKKSKNKNKNTRKWSLF